MNDRCPMCESPMVFKEWDCGKPVFRCGSDAVQSDECRRIHRIILERNYLAERLRVLQIKYSQTQSALHLERLRCRGCGSTAGNRCPQCTIVCQA